MLIFCHVADKSAMYCCTYRTIFARRLVANLAARLEKHNLSTLFHILYVVTLCFFFRALDMYSKGFISITFVNSWGFSINRYLECWSIYWGIRRGNFFRIHKYFDQIGFIFLDKRFLLFDFFIRVIIGYSKIQNKGEWGNKHTYIDKLLIFGTWVILEEIERKISKKRTKMWNI